MRTTENHRVSIGLRRLAATAAVCTAEAAAQAPASLAPAADRPVQWQHIGTCEESTIYVPWYVAPPSAEGGAFQIAATFAVGVTAAQTAVIQQAIDDWESIIIYGGSVVSPYPITFRNGALAAPTIGLHVKTVDGSGLPISSDITIDNDGSTCWFIDPTPGDGSEFGTGSIPCASASGNCTTDGTTGCTGSSIDLLTVVRHEIGHAVGWTSTTTLTGYMTGLVFDQGRWTIAMDPLGTVHADPAFFPGGLMIPSITSNTRTAIELYPDAVVGALHFDRDITMGFVDVDDGESPFPGTAKDPWASLVVALGSSPAPEPLLMAPGTYDEASSTSHIVIQTARMLYATNGGSAIIQ